MPVPFLGSQGCWVIEEGLEAFEEATNIQTVHQGMVNLDRDRHETSSRLVGVLAEDDLRNRIAGPELASALSTTR